MPSLFRVTLGAREERGIPEQIEFWTDLAALEDRLARPRALGRRVLIEAWPWPAEIRPLELAA